MKIIFLDFDGVMTSMRETPGSYLNHDSHFYGPSPSCVKRLISFCMDEDAKVVISSSWRKFEPNGKWSYKGMAIYNPINTLINQLGEHCIGMLSPERHRSKTDVIVEWLYQHPECESFVIFDDDLDEGFQYVKEHGIKDRFVKTDKTFGLTDSDCIKAKDILNRK